MRDTPARPPGRHAAIRRRSISALTTLLTLAAALAGARPATAAPVETAGPAGASSAFAEQVLFAQKSSGYSCFRIPAVVRAVDGTLLAFAEGRVASCSDYGDIDLVLRRSIDGGRTWGPLQVISEGNGSTHGNPVPIVDARTGRIVLVSTHNGPQPCPNGCLRQPYVQTSDDDGATWTTPRLMAEGTRPEWNFWYATGPMHGIQLIRGAHAGRLVLGANHESYDGGGGPHLYGAHLLYSDDSGVSWHIGASSDFTDGSYIPQEVTVVELTDGDVYALARDRGTATGHRSVAISHDGGQTFAHPFRSIDLPIADVQASTLRLHATDQGDAIDRILVSGDAHPVAREVMAVRSSFDEGRTWQSWEQGKVIWWGPAAYSDMVALGPDAGGSAQVGLLYEAGLASPYEMIRWAVFNEAYLATPNGTPPGIPGPPDPGPTTPDVSPAHNPAYLRGGISTGPGRFGDGMALDGVDDRIEVPFDDSIDLGGDDFTLMTWLRYTDTGSGDALLWLYRVGSGTPAVWLRAEPSSNRIRALITVDRFNVTVQSTTAYNDGQWHHVVLERVHGHLVLMVDGVVVSSAAAPPGSVTEGKEFGVQGLHVGQRLDGVNRLHGDVDEVRVYRRALSTAELDLIRQENLPIGGELGLRLPLDSVSSTTD